MNRKVDFKGFETQVSNARKIICTFGIVYVLYSKDGGFIFRKEISPDLEELIYDKTISFVGCYKKPLKSPDLIDDLEFVLSINQEKAA